MTSSKFFKLSTIALLLLNVGLICFLIFNRPPHPHHGMQHKGAHPPKMHEGPKQQIIKDLNFDESQITKYEALIADHVDKIASKDKTVKELKQQLYSSLSDSNSVLKTDIVDSLVACQREIEIIHFNHFKDIKGICKENQMDEFEALSKKLEQYFKGPKKPIKK